MPKKLPSPKEMKRAVEEFKKQFTGGFYHGSPSPNIKAFDPNKGDRAFPTDGVTFVTRDPDFADSFLGMNRKGEYEKGSTVYPVSVNLGKHFVPGSKEGSELIDQYINQMSSDPDAVLSAAKKAAALKSGAWDVMEDPKFLDFLKSQGHDTFTVMEGGVPNVGVFKPEHIRGKFAKFNPEDAGSPEIMKAAGGSIAKAAKKALEHARQVKFVHYSNKDNLTELDPRYYGTGIKGQESARLKSAPDIKPRSYFYTDRPDVRPEAGLGSHKYQGVAEDIYPLHEDPAGYSAIAKTKAIDPYMMQFGREVIDQPTHLNELERLIKGAGYKGYANDDVGLLFDPTPVFKAE